MNKIQEAGFTITELLVVIVVTSIMVLTITDFMMQNIVTGTIETAQATIQAEVQSTLDIISTDVRLSANADLNNRNPDPNSPNGATNQYSWTSDSSTLVLATAATDTSGNIIFSDPANYITTKNNLVYFVSGGTLYKRIIAANVSNNKAKTSCPASQATATCPADIALLHNVTNFSITYVDGSNNTVTATNARSIQISLTASKTQYKQSQSASYTTRMVFRND